MNCIGTSEEDYNTVRETKRRPSTNKFVDCGDYIKGITAKGVEYLIDKSDFEKVSKYSWCVGCGGRLVANISYKVVYMHRYILDFPDGIVDHINGNNKDNRRANLRITNCNGNARNSISKNKYGVNGIRLTKAGRYNARITVNYKMIHLGNFETLEEAIEARIDAEKKYYGEYAPYKRYEKEGENNGNKQ